MVYYFKLLKSLQKKVSYALFIQLNFTTFEKLALKHWSPVTCEI